MKKLILLVILASLGVFAGLFFGLPAIFNPSSVPDWGLEATSVEDMADAYDPPLESVVASSPGAFWAEDFELYLDGDDPADWLDTASYEVDIEEDLFYVAVLADGNHVFQTDSEATNIHSHLTSSALWTDYEFSGRMLISEPRGGVGVTIYSDYPNTDSYYRLRRNGSGAFHLAPHPDGKATCVGTTDTGVVPIVDVWYSFRFRAFDDGAATRVQAKVWQEQSSEPVDWQADCTDPQESEFMVGSVGVWSMSAGLKRWDDLEVAPVFGSCVVDSDCDDGSWCNGAETCINNTCEEGTPVYCGPELPDCFEIACVPTGGCRFIVWPDGTPCDDGNPLSSNDICRGYIGCYGTYPPVPWIGDPIDPTLYTIRWRDPNPDPSLVTEFLAYQSNSSAAGWPNASDPGVEEFTIIENLGFPAPDEDGIFSAEVTFYSYPAWVYLTARDATGAESAPSNIKRIYVPEPGLLEMLIAGIILLVFFVLVKKWNGTW